MAWTRGGGSELRFAEAEAASVAFSIFSDLSPFRRFMDILRKKPHLLGLVEVEAVKPDRPAVGGEANSLSES